MENITIVIPSYNPDVNLTMFIDELILAGFSDIIIVDDGSDLEEKKVQLAFGYVKDKKECKLIHHGSNMGKGAALKTAFKLCMIERPADSLVIMVDDDGQYGVEGICKCIEEYERSFAQADKRPVMLAARSFKESNYAKRKRMVNHISGFIMKYLCFVNAKDVQTGLRFIPHEYIRELIKVEGYGFDYEINMLVEMKYRNIPYVEETINIEDVSGRYADYNPVKDVLKFLGVMIRYAVSSLSATAVDIVAFYLLLLLFDSGALAMDKAMGMLNATIIARVISATFNCIVNKKAVFKSDSSMKSVIVRFYIFSLFRAIVSYMLVLGVSNIIGSYGDSLTVVVKLLIDLVLFFAGYGIQKKWIF